MSNFCAVGKIINIYLIHIVCSCLYKKVLPIFENVIINSVFETLLPMKNGPMSAKKLEIVGHFLNSYPKRAQIKFNLLVRKHQIEMPTLGGELLDSAILSSTF